MIGWILAVLALFVVQTLLPNAARAASRDPLQIAWLKGNRDDPPPATPMAARMERALVNMFEALVVFLPLAVLAVALDRAGGWVALGAAVFFGTAFSLALTLFVVPALYALIARNTTSPHYVSDMIERLISRGATPAGAAAGTAGAVPAAEQTAAAPGAT